MVDYNTGYSKLKLTAAGFRAGYGDSAPAGGQLWRNGQRGYYWSSSDNFNGTYSNAVELTIGADYAVPCTLNKSFGFSVRCIKDYSMPCEKHDKVTFIRTAHQITYVINGCINDVMGKFP